MRRYWWLLVAPAVLAALLLKVYVAAGQEGERFYEQAPTLVSGGWAYGFRSLGVLTPQGQEITGYAFGPGRDEVAFCGPTGERWALWKAATASILEARQRREHRLHELVTAGRLREAERRERDALMSQPYDRSEAAPRLLWTAPEGVALRGPVAWSPDGALILVRAAREGAADLVAVDDVTGEATWLTRGMAVIAAAFPATSRRLAYVTEERGAHTVWERDLPEGEARALGPGGRHLAWSPDAASLRWLTPGPGPDWAEMEWEAATGRVEQVGTKPARPEATTWSPDGHWCAAVTDEEAVTIWPAASSRGEEIRLPDVTPQRALGWSPDSNLLLILGRENALFAVTVAPPPPGAYAVDRVEAGPPVRVLDVAKARAMTAARYALETEAGAPSWSSDGRLLVLAARGTEQRGQEPERRVEGELFVMEWDRQYVEVMPELTPEIDRALAMWRMKNVALAFNMYLTDYDRVPPVAERDRVVAILEEYVRSRDVFMRPGKDDQVAVQWRFDPTKPLPQIEDPGTEVVAVMDYSPEFYVVAYMDGHVKLFEKASQ
jgi:hypothetical protein